MNVARIEAMGLSKKYARKIVVDQVDISFATGEIVGLLGPNGAGKTTCFYMIAGLTSPDTGVIRLADRDITRLSMHQRARAGIGYLPQEASIFRSLSVEENIMGVIELQRGLSRAEQRQKLEQLLDEFELIRIRKHKGISLSGGEQRRTEIARALAMEPNFMLFDEPFAGIDPISIEDLTRTIEKLVEAGIGVLIIDHNVRETLRICDRAYILSDGRVIATGTAEEIAANELVRKVYLGTTFET